MTFKYTAAVAAALVMCASAPGLAASVTLDFHLVIDAGSDSIAGGTNTPPFAGSLIVDDGLFGQSGVTPDAFSFAFFDRTVTDVSSGFNYVDVDLSATGQILAVDIGYDSAFDLSFDSVSSNTLNFAYDYTNGGTGSGMFVDGVIPSKPPVDGVIPLPATAFLMIGGLLGLAGLRRRR